MTVAVGVTLKARAVRREHRGSAAGRCREMPQGQLRYRVRGTAPRHHVDDAGNRTESNPVAIQVEGGHLHGRDDLAGLAVEDVDALVLAGQDRAGRAVHRDVGRGRSGDLCDRAAGAVDCVDASPIGDVERASRRVNVDARKAIAERDRMRDRQRAAVERPYCASTRGGGEAGIDGTGDRVNGQMGRRRSLSHRLVAAVTLYPMQY